MTQVLIELLRGKGAHADPVACIEDICTEIAVRQVAGFPHSIGQIVFHINYWMNYDLARMRGQRPKYPEHNAESFPPAPSPLDSAEWDRLRQEFEQLLAEHSRLAESSSADLERQIEPLHEKHNEISRTLEATLWQTATHNSYHIGQIAMIRRILGVWPPRAGGDTW